MKTTLRVAIVGTGFAGVAHARAARLAGADLVGVAASTPQRGVRAARMMGAERAFTSVEEALACPEVDLVHICLPNGLHAEATLAALRAGKHLICEKPISTDRSSADAVVREWRGSGLVAAVPFVYRYYPMVRELRSRVAAGEFGSLHLVHGGYLQDWLAAPDQTNWRVSPADGGHSRAFADIGSHWCDLAEFVTGERITRLRAQTGVAFAERPYPDGAHTFGSASGDGDGRTIPVANEDIALVQFRTDRGTLGSAVISQVAAGHKNALTLEVNGATGSAAFAQERPDTFWVGRRSHASIVSAEPTSLSEAAVRYATLPPGHPHGWSDCMDRFVAETYSAVDRGDPADGLPTLADGRRAAMLTDAVLRSAAGDGGWVTMEEGEPR